MRSLFFFYSFSKLSNNDWAAFCSAFLFDEPSPVNDLDFLMITETLNTGLCAGPEVDKSLYFGSSL
jgi:hypothetical protein